MNRITPITNLKTPIYTNEYGTYDIIEGVNLKFNPEIVRRIMNLVQSNGVKP